MWRNYLTVGFRALTKNRTYAFINIFGLSLGVAACLLILTFIRYELSYESWLPGAQDAYLLETYFHATKAGGLEAKSQTTSYVAGRALKKDFPQVERVVYAAMPPAIFLQDGRPTTTDQAVITDGPLFDVLKVPFLRGDPRHALDDPHALVVSAGEARKRFGDTNPIGKTLTMISGDSKEDYRISGVFQDIPKNSHLLMTIVARIEPAVFFRKYPSVVTSWHWQNGQIYVQLRPGTDPATIEAQFPAWKKRNIPDDPGTGARSNPGDTEDWHLENVRGLHLSEARGPGRPNSDRQTLVTFGIVALLILAMACVNFTNLATARASQRAREVALRKVLGATRTQLIVQFIGESMIVACLATLIGLALSELAMQPLNAFLDADMHFHYFGADGMLPWVLGLAVAVGVAGGLYPAVYLSRFQPARILKANQSSDAEGNGRLRNLLVVIQFAVSIGLIICTAVVYAQTVYARTVDSGYRQDGLLQVEDVSRPQAEAVMTTLLQEVRKLPGVTAAGRASIAIATGNNSDTSVNRPGREKVNLGVYGVDTQTFEALGIRLLAGRNFSETIALDDSTTPNPPDKAAEKVLVDRGTNVILSELAAKRLGFPNAAAAVGQPVQASMVSDELGLVPATVVGVVSDVRYRSVRESVQPIIYYYQANGFNQLLVRFAGNPREARARVEAVWKRLIPEIPFNSRFAQDIVHDLYNRDETRADLFAMFAILAVVIGCLGLFGLAAFTAERRTKEIGIRKVLGARSRDIVRLLAWQFSKPVLIANLIAWPIAWWVMRDWLNGFDNRVALGPTPFLLSGGLAVFIALGTIASHAFRVARANPVHALRYE